MQRIINLLLVFTFVFTLTLTIPYSIKIGKKLNYQTNISKVIGHVTGFDGRLLEVEFNKSIIQGCGDTEIHSFLVNKDGVSIQLKPIFLPEPKARELSDSKHIVFPISDILPLINSNEYKLQIFVKSDCSIFSNKSIELPSIMINFKEN